MNKMLEMQAVEFQRKWGQVVHGSREEEKIITDWEIVSNQMLEEAKTEQDYKTIFNLSPSNGPTENKARDWLDDLNIRRFKTQVRLLESRKKWRNAVSEEERKISLARWKNFFIKLLNQAVEQEDFEIAMSCVPPDSERIIGKILSSKPPEVAFGFLLDLIIG